MIPRQLWINYHQSSAIYDTTNTKKNTKKIKQEKDKSSQKLPLKSQSNLQKIDLNKNK